MKTSEEAIKEAEMMKKSAFEGMVNAAPKRGNNPELYSTMRRAHDYWRGHIEGIKDSQVRAGRRNYNIADIERIPPADAFVEAWRRGYQNGLEWQSEENL
jgi:hypothetical protein